MKQLIRMLPVAYLGYWSGGRHLRPNKLFFKALKCAIVSALRWNLLAAPSLCSAHQLFRPHPPTIDKILDTPLDVNNDVNLLQNIEQKLYDLVSMKQQVCRKQLI